MLELRQDQQLLSAIAQEEANLSQELLRNNIASSVIKIYFDTLQMKTNNFHQQQKEKGERKNQTATVSEEINK